MTVREAIERLDNLNPNSYTLEDKIEWLNRVEQTAYNDVLMTHNPLPGEYEPVSGERLERELCIPSPYDQAYVYLMMSQVDFSNAEIEKYNNSNSMYEQAYSNWRNWYNRTHEPRGVLNRFW